MKYIRGTALNAISDYGIAEGDAPPAGPGQVQIKVAACGIGYVDVLVALGGYQVKPALPLRRDRRSPARSRRSAVV